MNPPAPRRHPPRSLAVLALPALAPAFARFGFDEAALVTRWAEIVGATLAIRCRPLRLQWPKGAAAGRRDRPAATLVVAVEGPFALELQHVAPVVIERINTHAGWRCVGKIAMRQGPLPPPPLGRQTLVRPGPAARAAAAAAAASVADPELRDALQRLGAHVKQSGAKQARAT